MIRTLGMIGTLEMIGILEFLSQTANTEHYAFRNDWDFRIFVIFQWNLPKRMVIVSTNLIFNLIFWTKQP
jgi:hypothetical protein